MGWLRWKEGRQGTGYFKMLLAKGKLLFPFDLWLLKYPEGSFIDWHKDPVPEGKHYRLNIVLKAAKEGGNFISVENPTLEFKRVTLFRPDKDKHKVTKIKKGTRYVLSLGWID